jgi:hypothetical protein
MDGQAVQRVPPPTNSLDGTIVWSRSLPLLIVVAALAYGWLVYAFVSPYAGGSDSSGYLNFATDQWQLACTGAPVARVFSD